ncbi:MAG: phosphomannomutase/phosphoglucomutase [Candidatus Moranbacteria bacterium]|nr:phosphomannomutase/phosphoglucomutase [Candidatus Moranbacteria bacterium]
MNEKIFKVYDIRGVYPDEINEDAAYLIGKAFVDFLGCNSVVVGRDMRKSSPSLFEALARGITEQGANVIDIGMVTTPMLSFAVMNWNAETGIMISASHNPSQYNAFKLIKNEGKVAQQIFDGGGIEDIKERCLRNNFSASEKKGSITQKDIKAEYRARLESIADGIKGLKVVCDYGNGVGSISAKPVFDSLPVEVVHMYAEPNGDFPNHEPNPHEVENLKDLQKKVVEEQADLGIFFDGDADRSQLVNEKGEIIFPDVALGVLAVDALGEKKKGKVFHDLRFTKSVSEQIAENGGEAVMMRVGNPFYKEALKDDDGLIAGEFSGHIMFREFFGIDDGLYSALKFLGIMCKQRKKASELASPFQKYFQTEEINMKVTDADATIEKIREKYSDGKLITIDGILIDYGDWWLSLRKSNTEPLVRLRMEAKEKKLLEEKRTEVLGIIRG